MPFRDWQFHECRLPSAKDARAAVDHDRLTGDVAGVLAHQERHDGPDVLVNASHPFQWYLPHRPFVVLGGDLLPELNPGGVGEWADHVDPDVVAAPFEGRGL